MKIYVLMVCDRHLDPEPHLYADRAAALTAARDAAAEIGCVVQGVPPKGWLFNALHEEGDAVYVIEREIIS